MQTIYADNNATTAVAPEVVEAMMPFLRDQYFNPSSMYEPARAVAHAVAQARATVAGAFGLEGADAEGVALSRQILFTGCATESNNAAIYGAATANRGRRHVITTAVEHPAVFGVCKDLERNGYRVTFLPVDGQGNLDVRDFIRALDADTALVTIMHANNETGVIFPVEQLARITKETDPAIVFHTDATQSVGKLQIDLAGDFRHVDLLSFSGHKLHAPKGVGVLFVRRGTAWRPVMIGGHQEEGRRAGTENVPYIVGLARAVELAAATHADDEVRIRRLRDRLQEGLVASIPYVQVNGQGAPRLANTLNISFHSIEGESILYLLSSQGICASSGSACTSGSLEPSHVLRALGVPPTAIGGSVRFSLSRYNMDDEIERILDVMPENVANLRKVSPFWDKQRNVPTPDADS